MAYRPGLRKPTGPLNAQALLASARVAIAPHNGAAALVPP